MAGTKIINVLKDDAFKDILDLFRRTDAEDVVFVLPKRSAVFRREDHFAAFASEAARASKRISVLCSAPEVSTWARKYGFTVIAKAKPAAKLAAALNDDDEEVRDPNLDAFEADVPVTSDEKVGVSDEDKEDEMAGMHVVGDEEAEGAPKKPKDDEEDDIVATDDFDKIMKSYGKDDIDRYDDDGNLILSQENPVGATLAVAKTAKPMDVVRASPRTERSVKVGVRAKPAPVIEPEPSAKDLDLDYIDAVWRDKVIKGGGEAPLPANEGKGWRRWFPHRDAAAPRIGSRTRTALISAGGLVVLVGGALFILGLGKASAQVVPVSRDLEFQLNVQASDAFGAVDPLFGKIPGQLFRVEKSADREFPATGSKDVASKARGRITISNAYSSAPQTLIATTRFQAEELIYRTLRTVTVPGMSADGKPGTIAVDVVADKPGPDYNIAHGTFSIPAFAEKGDSERFAKFSADSIAAFTGGALGPSKVVTEDDIAKAKETVAKDLRAQIEEAFSSQAAGLKLLNSAEAVIGELTSSVLADGAAETFRISGKGMLKTVGFRENDLRELLTEHVMRDWQLTALPDKLALEFTDVAFADDRGVLAFTVTVTGKGYEPVDKDKIIADIKGMNREQIREYFKNAAAVRSSTVTISPPWVRHVPNDSSRITLEVLYEEPQSQ